MKFDEKENELIRHFHEHPFFKNFGRQTDDQFRDYLVQKWFLSQNFVPWYDRAINGLNDPVARDVLRKIVLDETPQNAPSHREDLIADLEYIGVPRSVVLTAKPTKETLKSKHRLDKLVDYTHDPNYDLRVMTALRIAGEILVAEEYRHVVPELERRFGLTPEKSRFYAPHFYHDEKGASEKREEFSHTDSFVETLEKLISDEKKLHLAMESAQEAFNARVSFYDQFTTKNKIRKTARNIGAAASLLLATSLFLKSDHKTEENCHDKHDQYVHFLQSANEETKEQYARANRLLLRLFDATGKPEYLQKIATLEATEILMEGP